MINSLVLYGIAFVQSQPISYTKRSKNIKKEYENYVWLEDKEGNSLNVPKPMYDHAMDGIRYAFSTLIMEDDSEVIDDPSLLDDEPTPLYSDIGL